MPPRKKRNPAVTGDRAHTLGLLKESYQALEEFHQTVAQRARNVSPDRLAGAKCISTFEELLEHFKTIIDHQADSPRDNARLVGERSRLCDFFRHQVAYLYSLPLKNIFLAINPIFPVISSPMLGLMSYIYHIKLEECRADSSLVPESRFKDDKKDIGQCWESILAAFGDGIRLFTNNAPQSSKLSQFQVMVGKVLYPFLAKVMGSQDSSNPHRLSEYVKRSLLDAGESLSGSCAENKELIRDPTIFGPAILSHIVFIHSDFITASIALQIAFSVAPPLKIAKGESKSARSSVGTKAAREDWFKQIFPAGKFGRSFQGQIASRLASMPSSRFWAGLGAIHDEIFQNDESRACAVPIQSGTIAGNDIKFNSYEALVLKDTVQFNKHSLTWNSLVSEPDVDSVSKDKEMTSEICYEAISSARLTGMLKPGARITQCKELTLSIEFRSDRSIRSCAPTIYYTPDNSNIRSTLVLRLKPEFADAISSILRQRKIKLSYAGSYFDSHQTDDEDTKIVAVDSDPLLPVTSEKITRETSKISISKQPVCSWEADHPFEISPPRNSRQRVESVQREAGINSSREEDSNSVSEHVIDLGSANDRSPSIVIESNFKSSPTVVHTETRMSTKRKDHPRISSPVETSCTRKESTRAQKLKRTRIIESPDDSIHLSPSPQSWKGPEKELKKALPSVTRQAHETKANTPLVKIPLLKSKSHDDTRKGSDVAHDMSNVEDSTLARKKSNASARSASEMIDSCSDAEAAKKHPARHESIDSIDEAYEEIVTNKKLQPISRDESEVEDEILSDDPEIKLTKLPDKPPGMKMTKSEIGRKNKDAGHLRIIDKANGFRSVAHKDESSRTQQTENKVPKDSSKAKTERLENWKPVPELKQKGTSPTKSRLERTTSSPEIDIIQQTHSSVPHTAFGPDILKKADHRKKVNDQEEPNETRTQHGIRISDLGKNLSTRPQKVFGLDGSNVRMIEDSKPKKSPERPIHPIFSEVKRSAQTPSSVNSVAQKRFNLFEEIIRPVKSSEASSSKRVERTMEMDQLSSTPLSRLQLGGSARSKGSEDLRKPKHIRFESPGSVAVQQKISGSTSHDRNVSQRDTPPLAEEDRAGENRILHSVKRKRIQPDILMDNKDPLKSALKTNTPCRPAARLNLKKLQMGLENDRLCGSSMLEIDQETPDGLYPSSSTSGKHVDRSKKATSVSPLKYSDLENGELNKWEEDSSSCMNQLTEMVVAGIKNKQVKIQGVAATTQLGVLNSTNNFIKELDDQSEAIKQGIAQHALQTKNEYRQYHHDIKQYRIKMEQDVNRINNHIDERTKEASPEAG